MVKKILYIFVSFVLGFVVFSVSLTTARSKSVVRQGNAALEVDDLDFFLMWNEFYEKDAIFVDTYEIDDNSTEVRIHNAYSKSQDVSGFIVLLQGVNTEKVYIDEKSFDELAKNITNPDEIYSTKVLVTADNGNSWTFSTSTFGHNELPIMMFSFTNKSLNDKLAIDDVFPKYITSIKISDAEGFVFYEATSPELIDLGNSSAEHWDAKIENGSAVSGFSEKEMKKKFSFPYPEMWSVWLSTSITLIILAGLGLFIFWPKKSYTPTDTEDRLKYTYAPKEKATKKEIDKVDQAVKEKEFRENRYKSVRTSNGVIDAEDIIEESIKNEEEIINDETKSDEE